jgi:hypothetical protein
MADHGCMTITGNAQGLISAGCLIQETVGNKIQTGKQIYQEVEK